jgi:hypothetical protein
MDQTGISEAVGRESRVLLLPLSSPAMKSNKKCSSLDQLSFLLFRKLMEKPRVSSRKEKLNKNDSFNRFIPILNTITLL